MKTVARVLWIHEADLIKSKLELHGIQAFIPDEGMATANPLLGNAIGGIRVQVGDGDYELAREIIGEKDEPVEQGDLLCPSCGSDETDFGQWSKRAFFVSILFLGIPFLWLHRESSCRACGYRWKN